MNHNQDCEQEIFIRTVVVLLRVPACQEGPIQKDTNETSDQ